MRCGGGSTTTSSLGCGAVLAGCGALRGEPGPGGKAGGGAAVAPCCGGWAAGGAAKPPGGGGSGCDWMPPAPGRFDGGKLMGAGSGCGGGVSRAPGGGCCGCCCGRDAGAFGTSAGGRGGPSPPKIEPNWANAGCATSSVATANNATALERRAIKIRFFRWPA